MPAQPPPRTAPLDWALAALIGLAAFARFGHDLAAEPHFVDESAIIAKSYYADLWPSGRDDPAWLAYPALDHPPLAQYLTGTALRLGRHPFPPRWVIWAWYRDTRTRGESAAALTAARWPSVALGAAGCVAIYALGTLIGGRRVGVVAALLLMINPLYALHARRAIGDAPCEALILGTLAVGLAGWRESLAGRIGPAAWATRAVAAGVLGGLAVLAKLNGALGLITLVSWAALAAVVPGFGLKGKAAVAGLAVAAGAVGFGTFVALNPLMTAHPRGSMAPGAASLAREGLRGRAMATIRHRVDASEVAQGKFPRDALRTPGQKLATVAVQGFGRFGPFGPAHSDSTHRFDRSQDWGALIWWPWVSCGAAWAAARGRAQRRAGEPPTAWALGVYALTALVAVTAFIPLAWDRYLLDLQPGAALLAAGAAVAGADRLARGLRAVRSCRIGCHWRLARQCPGRTGALAGKPPVAPGSPLFSVPPSGSRTAPGPGAS